MTFLEAMDEYTGVSSTVLADIFSYMEIAEELIAKAQEEYPADAGRIYDVFRWLAPSNLVCGKMPLYRAHVWELIQRKRDGLDLRTPTKAELLAGVMEMATDAPLGQIATYLAMDLFIQVFPDNSINAGLGDSMAAIITANGESFTHELAEEFLVTLTRRLQPVIDMARGPDVVNDLGPEQMELSL